MSVSQQSPYAPANISIIDIGEASFNSHSGSESEDDQQNGSRKRKRPMNVTCEACKNRKVKCDRARPSCSWCQRNNHECEYKERRKPGLRAGYGRELESRLDRLESLITQQAQQLAAHLTERCSASNAPQSLVPPKADRIYHQSNLVVHNDNSQAHDEMIDPELHSLPNITNRSSLQDAPVILSSLHAVADEQVQPYAIPSAQSLTSPHASASFQNPSSALGESPTPLPPYDLLYTLVDLYFKHINIWLPLLDRKSTLDILFGPAPLAEADRVLLHAIVATALRYCTDSRLTLESRRQYHTTSKQRVQLFGIDNSSVRSLQALVIIALDVTGTTNGPPGWNMLSLISRSVVQLGLAAELISSLDVPLYPSIATLRAAVLPEPKSYIEDEERRRLFWSVFLLDRYATVATAFDFALDEKEIDRRLPCRDDLFSVNRLVDTKWFGNGKRSRYESASADKHGHFSYHCELLGILGRIHQFLKRAVDIGSLADVEQWQASYRTLDNELYAWQFNLPDDFASVTRPIKSSIQAKGTSSGWIMLRAAYCLTVIRLNSSAAYPAQTSPIFSSSFSAMQRCLSAVTDLRQLGYFVKTSGLLDKIGPPFAFAAWVSARVMLVHGSTMDHEVDPDIDFFVTLLSEIGQYWQVAQRYSDILHRVLEEYRGSRRDATVGGRVTPSTMKILADMRRCAFDLDFLISRQPPNGVRSQHPTRASTPAPHELEYLDVFDLFNFPRLPLSGEAVDQYGLGQGLEQGQVTSHGGETVPSSINVTAGFAAPDPDTDWLFPPR